MTKRILIVSHCYCPPGLDIYAQHLRLQWASLCRYLSKADVELVVCCANSKQDPATWEVLTDRTIGRAKRVVHVLPLEKLFRRATGRNEVVKDAAREFEVVWFTDVDYLFGPGCLDAVADLVTPDDELCMPEVVNISIDHATGTRYVEDRRNVPLPDIDPTQFAARRQKLCIGGVQIVGGNTARRVGYCDGTRWVRPVDPAAGFRSCRCDLAFRRGNKFVAKRLPIPGVYRLRHERAGRDVGLNGQFLGRKGWR